MQSCFKQLDFLKGSLMWPVIYFKILQQTLCVQIWVSVCFHPDPKADSYFNQKYILQRQLLVAFNQNVRLQRLLQVLLRSFISNTGGFDNQHNEYQKWVFISEIQVLEMDGLVRNVLEASLHLYK